MLNHELESLDGLPELIAKEYKPKADGGFVLDLDENPLAAKVKEFRTTNVQLRKNNEELRESQKAFGEHTPESIAELTEKVTALESDSTPDEKQQAIFESRLEEVRNGHAKELNAREAAMKTLQEQAAKSTSRLQEFTIERDIVSAVTNGAKPRVGAMDDILSRARETWRFDNEGILGAFDANGDQRFGPKGEPLSREEWVAGLVDSAPHLFESKPGGDAGGNVNTGPGGSRSVPSGDAVGIGRNLADIAAGKVRVQ